MTTLAGGRPVLVLDKYGSDLLGQSGRAVRALQQQDLIFEARRHRRPTIAAEQRFHRGRALRRLSISGTSETFAV
jgi:hypothetical protein